MFSIFSFYKKYKSAIMFPTWICKLKGNQKYMDVLKILNRPINQDIFVDYLSVLYWLCLQIYFVK